MTAAPSPAPADPAASTTASAGRRSGHLYPQVAAYLAARPDQVFKVGEITTAIGAPSAGAVFEALKRMAAAGPPALPFLPWRCHCRRWDCEARVGVGCPRRRSPPG